VRLRLVLENKAAITIPWDYRTALTAAVYETLAAADPEYSHWLHRQGFQQRQGHRTFRLFVYSDFMPVHYEVVPKGLANVQWLGWHLSSPDKRFVEKFIDGLKRKGMMLSLFGNFLEVLDVAVVDVPSISGNSGFHTISPIVVAKGSMSNSRHPVYLRPDDPEFVDALERNLIAKWEAFHQKVWNGGEFGIRVWAPKSKLVPVFNICVRAWHLRLQMWGSDELICFAYDAGLGIKNSQGFGMIEPGG